MATTAATAVFAAPLDGQVLGAGAPIANATVTLWQASSGAPTATGAGAQRRRRPLRAGRARCAAGEGSLYLVARGGTPAAGKGSGDNPAIALMTVLGAKAPAKVTINEMTTVASVWTHNQFIDGEAIKGQPLQLKIAAGNVPSFVDLATGGWGGTIQDPLNSGQTPTMANFATLANVLAGCVTRVRPEACETLFARRQGTDRRDADRHADRGAGDRARAVVSAGPHVQGARGVVSGAAGQDDARRCPTCPTCSSRPAPGCCR